MLDMAARHKWQVFQLDVKTAFLNGDIDTDVHMIQPPGFQDGTSRVCKLKRSFYGLKQAPRQWYLKLKELLTSLGFQPVTADSAFWINESEGSVVYMNTFVDDMMIVSKNPALSRKVAQLILATFPGTFSEDLNMFCGMKVTWLPDGTVVLSQPSHIADLIAKYKPPDEVWEPRELPIKPGLKLHRGGTSDHPNSPPLNRAVHDFMSFIGSFNWLAHCTRADIAFVVNQLSKFTNYPTQAHWDVAIDLLKYLLGTMHMGIHLGHSPGYVDPQGTLHEVLGYADSEFGTGINDKRPTAGHVFMLYGGCLSWCSHTQKLVSTSTCEAEYRQMAEASKEAMWLSQLLRLFGVKCSPFLIRGDNNSAIQAVKSLAPTRNTKHIEIQLEFMRQRYAMGELDFQHVRSEDNPADIFTKALPSHQFKTCRKLLGMVTVPE